ncbi:MAG TPA: efflux RND transporter periplasmic adaptor subunit [Chlamydiales bacterium]|nr:efflux RND transporter periplasmic adaptor subunit [Chlamydiales bacterium]
MRIVLIFLVLLCGCHSKKKETPIPTFAIRVATAQIQDIPIFVEGLGHVDSMTSIEIRSRIEGELTGVYFVQGKEVKKGDLLFTIDPKPYEAALKQAKGTLEQSLADLAISEEKVKRYKMLAKDEYYSQIDYETLQANFAANIGLVEQNQAQVDSAAINLDYCWIYAPIDGLTGLLQIDFGNLVSADGQQEMITLNQMDPIFVTFSIPEIQLPKVQKWIKKNGDPLKVMAAYEDFTEETFEGKLYMVDNTVDNQTGMIKLRGIFDNQSRGLWPGQFIRTRVQLYVEKNAIVMPYTAVQLTLTGPVVFIVKEDNTIEQRTIKLGQRQDDNVIVLEGVKAHETVVTEGQLNLYTGAKVSIKK